MVFLPFEESTYASFARSASGYSSHLFHDSYFNATPALS